MPTKRKPPPAKKRKPKRGVQGNGVMVPDHIDFEALVAEQGVKPINDIRELMGDFWPENESVDEFLAARKRWQQVPQGRKR